MTITQNINIDEIGEALVTKADIDLNNTTRPYIIETWSSGTSWYRVWSDGFKEQGGYYDGTVDGFVWVSFFKTYNNLPIVTITRFTTAENDDSASSDRRHVMVRGIETTRFRAWGVWAGYKYMWSAQGY